MTRSMSAASATASVTAVEGVSGEIATPAFIPRAWMWSMIGSGSSSALQREEEGGAARSGLV